MSQFMQSRPIRRAPRVNLRGSLSCTLQLENGRRLIARMHQLSITGGLLEVPAYVEERTWVGLTLALGDSLLYPTVEMLFPMRGGVGYLQPFRIARMRETERHQLDREITNLLQQNVTPASARHSSGFRPPRFYLET